MAELLRMKSLDLSLNCRRHQDNYKLIWMIRSRKFPDLSNRSMTWRDRPSVQRGNGKKRKLVSKTKSNVSKARLRLYRINSGWCSQMLVTRSINFKLKSRDLRKSIQLRYRRYSLISSNSNQTWYLIIISKLLTLLVSMKRSLVTLLNRKISRKSN